MATMNISLPDPMKNWVESQVDSGIYSNSSDYIRDLIRRDQINKKQNDLLSSALIEGEKSGKSKKSLDDVWNKVKSRKYDE